AAQRDAAPPRNRIARERRDEPPARGHGEALHRPDHHLRLAAAAGDDRSARSRVAHGPGDRRRGGAKDRSFRRSAGGGGDRGVPRQIVDVEQGTRGFEGQRLWLWLRLRLWLWLWELIA